MSARSYARGHEIVFNQQKGQWLYADTGQVFDDSRPCKRCGKHPTEDGCDACLGHIQGAESACCGHGVSPRYIVWKETTCS